VKMLGTAQACVRIHHLVPDDPSTSHQSTNYHRGQGDPIGAADTDSNMGFSCWRTGDGAENGGATYTQRGQAGVTEDRAGFLDSLAPQVAEPKK
jgi:hypothetical protein